MNNRTQLMKAVNPRSLNAVLLIMMGLYLVSAVFILARSSQNIIWDPGLCFKMTDNARRHIPFNYYAHPNPKNLAADQQEFVTWWSPGQYALPMLLENSLHIKLANAIRLLIMLCLLVAAWGIYKLFYSLLAGDGTNVRPEYFTTVSLALLLFTLIQPFFWWALVAYDGGGILMLAYCPWFLFFIVKYNRLSLPGLVLILIGAFAGFFLKSAFTGVFAGALLYLFLVNSEIFNREKKADYKKIFKNGFVLAGTFLIYYLVIKYAFLAHNRGISNSSTGFRLQPRVFVYPWVAPVLGFFSLSSVVKTSQWLVAFALVAPLYYFIFKSRSTGAVYKYVLFSLLGAIVVFYTALYFLNVDVSYEQRHYLIISILLTPAIFLSFGQWRRLNLVILTGLGLYTIWNAAAYVKAIGNAGSDTRTHYHYSGLVSSYPAGILDRMDSLDKLPHHGRDIFYFKSADPCVALEIRNNRVLLEDNFINFHFDNRPRFDSILYRGVNNGELYVIYPLANFKADSLKFLTRFEKYKRFDKMYQTNTHVILRGVPDSGQLAHGN